MPAGKRTFNLADSAFRLALHAVSPAGSGARLSVVLFHRVLAAPDPMFPDDIDQSRFRQICDWLAAWFNVLPLDQAVRQQADGCLPARALSITFDDGYADNHDLAMPILLERGLSATFFIASGFLNGGRMWNDTVVEALRRCTHRALDLSALGLAGLGRLDLSSAETRRQATHRLLSATKYLPLAERQEMVDRIARLAGTPLPNNLMMSTDQLRAMQKACMQIGAHTVTHPILARLDDRQAASEINTGKATLEAMLQQPMTLFAYPNGKPGQDYLPRDVALVRQAGFTAAVSTAQGAWRPSRDDILQLPRFTPWDTQRLRFGARMARNYLTKLAPV